MRLSISGGISGGATFFGVNREWRHAEWNERDSLFVKKESYTAMKTGQAWARTRLKQRKTQRQHWSCGGDLETWAQLGSAVMLSFENYLETDHDNCSSKVLHERRPHRVSYPHCWYGLMKEQNNIFSIETYLKTMGPTDSHQKTKKQHEKKKTKPFCKRFSLREKS